MRRPATYFVTVLNRLMYPKNIELYIIQAVMCHTGDIPCNKSDQWVLKNFQGRPYETSCKIFCNSSKQIDVYKSPKNIDLYTIQAVMCHTDDILRNKSDLRILNKSQGRAYFVTVLNKLTSTHLPKTLICIQGGFLYWYSPPKKILSTKNLI